MPLKKANETLLLVLKIVMYQNYRLTIFKYGYFDFKPLEFYL